MGSKWAATLRPSLGDIHVYRRPGHCARPQFFASVSGARIARDVEQDRILIIDFAEGGRVEVVNPTLVWVEPERH